jgi:DNA-directed RNA polymerase specialized sigma24 family protein
MTRERRNDPGEFDPEEVPPFWLHADGDGAEPIDPRVLSVARKNWPWAFWLTKRELHDGANALEIVEYIAAEVSKRLKADPEIDRNLNAYYKTAFTRRVRAVAARNGRILYEGSPQDLETNHQPIAADWIKLFEDRMVLKALLPYATDSVRRILNYRLLDYSWKEISRQLAVSEKQAKSRFYYGVHQARERLAAAQEKRALGGESA